MEVVHHEKPYDTGREEVPIFCKILKAVGC